MSKVIDSPAAENPEELLDIKLTEPKKWAAGMPAVYEAGKGTVKFPFDKPIPFDLISKIVKFRAKENVERAEAKGKK